MKLTEGVYDAVALALADKSSWPVAFYGVHFTPPDSGPYLQLLPFFNDNRDYFDFSMARGFFRVNVVDQAGHGPMRALKIAEQVATWLPMGSKISSATITGSAGIGGPIPDSDRLIVPVTFRWMCPRPPVE